MRDRSVIGYQKIRREYMHKTSNSEVHYMYPKHIAKMPIYLHIAAVADNERCSALFEPYFSDDENYAFAHRNRDLSKCDCRGF